MTTFEISFSSGCKDCILLSRPDLPGAHNSFSDSFPLASLFHRHKFFFILGTSFETSMLVACHLLPLGWFGLVCGLFRLDSAFEMNGSLDSLVGGSVSEKDLRVVAVGVRDATSFLFFKELSLKLLFSLFGLQYVLKVVQLLGMTQ